MLEPRILQLEHLGYDIDRPDDIATFLLISSPTQSHAYLTANGIAERLRRAHRDRRDQVRAG